MADRWGWGSQLIPVLNFGYFPQQINDEINNITEEFLPRVMRNADIRGNQPFLTFNLAGFEPAGIQHFKHKKSIQGEVKFHYY